MVIAGAMSRLRQVPYMTAGAMSGLSHEETRHHSRYFPETHSNMRKVQGRDG